MRRLGASAACNLVWIVLTAVGTPCLAVVSTTIHTHPTTPEPAQREQVLFTDPSPPGIGTIVRVPRTDPLLQPSPIGLIDAVAWSAVPNQAGLPAHAPDDPHPTVVPLPTAGWAGMALLILMGTWRSAHLRHHADLH